MFAEPLTSSERTLPVPAAGLIYTPHRPEQTLLHRTIREQLESFLAQSCERGHPVPRFVEQELRAFLRCGILAHGFLRLRCDDGVYVDARGPGRAPRFLPLPPPDDDEVARVLAGTARRLQRLVSERAGEDEDALARDEPLLANERLEELPDGRLALRLKTRWRDGTSHILMERSELIERLVPLIPPPRAHQLRFHGILAPCASWRDRVVPAGDAALAVAERKPAAETDGPIDHSPKADSRSSPTGTGGDTPGVDPRGISPNGVIRYRRRWAELLQRVFGIDALRCPRCGSTLRLVAAIEDPDIARKILECLKLPARAPPLEPASVVDDPPQPAAPDHAAAWDFDQSLRYEDPELP